jgi:hypothetical protein
MRETSPKVHLACFNLLRPSPSLRHKAYIDLWQKRLVLPALHARAHLEWRPHKVAAIVARRLVGVGPTRHGLQLFAPQFCSSFRPGATDGLDTSCARAERGGGGRGLRRRRPVPVLRPRCTISRKYDVEK